MICPISNENLKNLKVFVIDKLEDSLNQQAPLSVKGLMASVYNEFGKDVPSDQALSFVQQVPTILRELMKADDAYQEGFASNLPEIISIQKQLDTDTPLKSVVDYLKDTLGISPAVLEKVEQSIASKAGFTTIPQDEEFYDPSVVAQKERSEISFLAKPSNPNSTTGSEVDPQGVPYPDRIHRYKFIRTVLAEILKGNIVDSTESSMVEGGIRLTAMAAAKLGKFKPAGMKDTDAVMVITDSDGKILRFNTENKVSEDGSPMFYGMRNLKKTEKGYSIEPAMMNVEDIVRRRNLAGDPITMAAFKQAYKEDLDFLYQLKDYIEKNPNEMVMTIIDGGSNGYIPFDETTVTMLSDIDFSDDPLNIQIQKSKVGPFEEGTAYFNVRGVSNPIRISRKPMAKDLVDRIVSLLVDKVYDRNTSNEVYELSNDRKLELVLQYRANTKNVFSAGVNEATDNIVVTMNGESVEVTPENKEEVRKKLTNFFTIPQPIMETAAVPNATNGNSPTFDPKSLRQGAIVKFTAGGETKYFKYVIPEFTINQNLLKDPNTFNHFDLVTQADGSKMIVNRVGDSNGGMNYIKFIKTNSFVKYSKSPGDNKLRQANAYFTFQVPEDQKRKVIPVANTIEEIQEEVKEPAQKVSKPTKSASDQFIEDIENGLYKTNVVKTGEVVATPEQIAKAKAWFDKSPLREHIGFQELFNAVNSEAVAEFFDGAIVLYAGADYSDLYHESWHAFSQMYMTIDQKVKLYEELGKKSGSFTTNTGKRVTFSEATYQELEEYLAEDFREYMLADGKTYNGPVRNSIFRKILDFLKSLFGDTTYQQMLINDQATNTVQELYEKLRVGNLTGYTFSAKNQMFGKLNKGAEATSSTEPIQALSPADSIEARKTIDSIFSSFQDELNLKTGKQYTNHIFRTLKGRMTAYSRALEKLKERREEILKEVAKKAPKGLNETDTTVLNAYIQTNYGVGTTVSYTDNKGDSVSGEVTGYLTDKDTKKITTIRVNNVNVPISEVTDSKVNPSSKEIEEGELNLVKRNLETLNWMINNYGDPMDIKTYGEGAKGLIAYHNKKSEFLSFEDRGTEDAADNNVPERFKLAGNETSTYEAAKPEVLYMLRGLQKMEKKVVKGKVVYEPVYNRLGFPELIDLTPVVNRLSKVLHDSADINEMQERLINVTKETDRFYYINQLLSKLGDASNPDPMVQDMWGAFYQTFNRYFVNQPIVYMDKVDGKWVTRTGTSYGDKNGIKRIWDINFSRANTESPFVKRPSVSKAATLDLVEFSKKYPTQASIDRDRVGFLRDLGIPIEIADADMRRELYENPKFTSFGKYMLDRINLLKSKSIKIGDVRTFFSAKIDGKSENKLYGAIVDLFVEFSDNYSDSSLSTPEGDKVYALSLNSSATAVAKGLNGAMSFSEDVLSNHLAYLDHSRNPWAKRSWSLYSMFNPETGYSRRMEGANFANSYIVENIPGLTILENGESVDLGISSSSADETAALMMSIAYFIQRGAIVNPTPGEKSTRLSTRVSRYFYSSKNNTFGSLSKDGKIWMDVEHFAQVNAPTLSSKIYYSVIPYLLSEVDRIAIMKRAESNPEMMENNFEIYKENGKKFFLFDQMISKSTKDTIMGLMEEEGFDLESYLDSNTTESLSLRGEISKDLMAYWETEFQKTIDLYEKGGLITDDILDQVVKSSPSLNKYRNFRDVRASRTELETAILKGLSFNTYIHNMEATILNYGDPAQYATEVEFHKRIQMFSSTGEIFRTDAMMMGTMNQMLTSGYAKSIGINFKGSLEGGHFSNILNTAIMDDPKMNSVYIEQIAKGLRQDITRSRIKYNTDGFNSKSKEEKKQIIDAEVEKQTKAYMKMKVADAQGWVTFDSYRLLGKAMNDWSPAQEDLFQRIVRGENVDVGMTIKHFPVMKYQYAGALATKEGLPVMAGHKFSLMPLIPNVIQGSPNLVALHEKMMRSNVDYATMKSGSKITTITHAGKLDQFYKDGDLTKREFDSDRNDDGSYKNPFMPNKVYMEFLKKQQPTGTEYKGSSIFATQLRKIIEEGLLEGGVPTDFMPDETNLDTKIKAWEKYTKGKTDEEIGKAYPKYLLYTAYEKALSDLTNKKKEKLLKDIGWDSAESYGKVNTKLLEFLRKEMGRQDVSDHEMSYLDIMYNGALKYNDLSLHLSQELIEKVILSIVNRNLIRQKINGEPLIQVSGLGWENMSQWKSKYSLTNPTEEQIAEFGTNGLTYYQYGKGPNGSTLAMTVKIALQGDFKKLLNLTHKDGNQVATLDRLNETIKDEEWLNTGNNRAMITMVGVRIPVQGLNSMEFMQVAEFLPENAGNMIVLPAEIVAKSGSDFDIDKLSIYMPNIKSTKEAGVSLESGDTEGAAENKLMQTMINILSVNDNYASLVRPNDTYTLDPIVNNEDIGIRDFVSDYNPKVGPDGTKLSKISGSDLMQYRYNLYVHVVNKVAQEALGIAAVDNTFNILFNRVGARMNQSYRDGTTKQLKTKTQGVIKDITLFVDHNTLKDEKGNDVISLSHMMDAKGEHKISDNISQVINLLLEIAKNDSAYYLQLNKEAIPTILFLNQAGVPIKQLAYFVSHPVIREYMSEIRKARTPVSDLIGTTAQGDRNYFVSAARKRIMEKYDMISYDKDEESDYRIYMGFHGNPKGKEAHKNMYGQLMSLARNADGTKSDLAKKTFDADNLFNDIKTHNPNETKGTLSPEEQLILLHWFHIEDFAKTVVNIKTRLNFDTSRTKSAFMSANKKAMIESIASDQRMPYKVVQDILEKSAISSLYLVDKNTGNPFVMDLLVPLLPLRANAKISAFINSKLSDYGSVEEIEDMFGSIDRFVNQFMNDMVGYIFQDKLRSFDITSIRGYRNMVVEGGVGVEKVPYLKFGAFVKDGVMYIDTKQLIKDFQEGNYLIPGSSSTISGENYMNRGLAPLGNVYLKGSESKVSEIFTTPGEYFNFVLEREYIRSNTKAKDLEGDIHYEDLKQRAKKANPQRKEEDADAYGNRITSMVYEQWIRDRALDNIGNGWKLFYSEDSYAKQIDEALNKYGLRTQFPLLENLVVDEKEVKSPYDTNQSLGIITNLRLLDYDLTGEKVDAYHKIISDLSNPGVIKVDAKGNPLSASENRLLSELFSRMPLVAFLQSGLNTNGQFSLTRLVPAEKIMDFLSGSVADYIDKIDINTLNKFYDRFVAINGNYTLSKRYKNYTQGMIPSKAERTKLTALFGMAERGGDVEVYAVSPFYGLYNTSKLNMKSATETAKLFPDRIFVYDKATGEVNPKVGSSGYFSPEKSKVENVLGIPTRLKYGDKESDSLSDDTLEANMLLIEQAIQRLKVMAKTRKLTFSDTGYGQNLIGLKEDAVTPMTKDGIMPAPMTFMYLSQRLFEEFNYVNPNYEGQKMQERVTLPSREPGNITEVDLSKFISERKAKLGHWKKDSAMMNNSQAAIAYPLTPLDSYESSSVAYAKALNEAGIKTGIQDFTGVKAVWIFGNLAGFGKITEAMLKPHFDGLYKQRINEAISAGVEIFNLGDAKSGIDVMAAEYLKTIGFRPIKHEGWTSWTREAEKPIGELTFSPEMLGKIKSGKKTIMSGNMDLTPGIYKLPDGSMIRVATPIIFKTLRDVSATPNKAEGWAKAEGYDSFADLKSKTQSQFIKDFVALKANNLRVYALSKVEAPLTEREKAIAEANKRIDEESYLLIENDDIYQEFNGYEDLLFAYENDEIAPELMDAAYQELRSVNLLKYLNYNPNQLSLTFPSQSVINGEILEPSQVLASKSVVNDNDVMDQIMRCITG
jgi:hypothetical protein